MEVEKSLRPKVLIAGEDAQGMYILDRMNYYKVPGVSIAVVNNGQVDWAQGYGTMTDDPQSPAVDQHTLFQAASISKALTALPQRL